MQVDAPQDTSNPIIPAVIVEQLEEPSVTVTVTYSVSKDSSVESVTELISRLNNNLDELLVQKKNLKGIRRDLRGGPATSRTVKSREDSSWNPFRSQYERNQGGQTSAKPIGFAPRKRPHF